MNDDDDEDFLEQLVELIWQGKAKYSEETCPGATLYTTKSHMTTRSRNPDRSGGKPATNRLSYGAALALQLVPRNFSRGGGVIPSLAERGEQTCQRGYFQFGM
jgi:hypothetical protein